MRLLCRSAVVIGALWLVACGSKSDAERLSQARQKAAAGDLPAATVLLKEALQSNERLAEARALLGIISLDGGDSATAILDLRKAIELGCEPDQCVPPLARALLMSGQRRALVGEFGSTRLTKQGAQADLQTSLAVAWAAEGQPENAQESLQAALTADPTYLPGRLLEARALMAKRRIDDALSRVASILDANPKSSDAWLLKGELLQAGKGDLAGATVAYDKALELDPRSLPAHISVVTNALEAGRREEAERRLTAMVAVRRGHPQTLALQARVALMAGQLTAAREAAQHWLKQTPMDPLAYLVSGEIEMRAGSRTSAQSALKKCLGLSPRSVPARLMLSQIQVQEGQAAAALETLAPLLQAAQPPAEALGQGALAQLMQGQSAAAQALIARGAKAYPDDPRFSVAAALAQVASGDGTKGLARLEALAATDKTGLADVALVNQRVVRADMAGALKALASAEQRQPANPLLPVWRGQVHERLFEYDKARAAYEQALKVDRHHLRAVEALNELDIASDKPQAALDRMTTFAGQNARSAQVLLARASLMRRVGKPAAEVQAVIEDAQRVDPTDPTPVRELVLHHLRSGQPQRALSVAQTAAEAFKGDAELSAALGQAQIAAGETRQAVTTFTQVASARPKDPQVLVQLARALSAAGDMAGARDRLRQAVALAPDLRPAHQGLVEVAVATGQWQSALDEAQAQQRRQPGRPEGWIWEASVHAARRQWAPAIEALKTAQGKGGGSDAALKLHAAYLAAGRAPDAQRLAADWMTRHPRDASMPLMLGDLAARREDLPEAEVQYRKALAIVPDDVPTLNNLAWTLARQGKPGGVAFAERANQLEPERGDLLDTLAMAQLAENQAAKAFETQKLAVEKAPSRPEIRLNLARMALKRGDKPLARQELLRLAELGDNFSQQAEVNQLLKASP